MKSRSSCTVTRRSPAVWAIFTWAVPLLALASAAGWVRAGIPEPDLVWYGRVLTTSGGAPVRLAVGTLVWRIEPLSGGDAIVLTTQLMNINDQFSFVLRVPCETPEPGGTVTAGTVSLSGPTTRYRRATVTLDGQPLALVSAPDQFAPNPADRGRLEQIDLSLGSSQADSDGDGLPDAWEQQFFGGLSANPNDDFDKDGVSNLREFRAGTHPKDPRSLFEVVEINALTSGIQIRWSSQSNRRYRIRRSPALLGSVASYEAVRTGITGTPPLNEFIDTQTAGRTQFFYLIEIE